MIERKPDILRDIRNGRGYYTFLENPFTNHNPSEGLLLYGATLPFSSVIMILLYPSPRCFRQYPTLQEFPDFALSLEYYWQPISVLYPSLLPLLNRELLRNVHAASLGYPSLVVSCLHAE